MKRIKWPRKMHIWGKKMDSRNLNVISGMCVEREAVTIKEISMVKERPTLGWSEGKGTLMARSHPTNLANYRRKGIRSFLLPERQMNAKAAINVQGKESPTQAGS